MEKERAILERLERIDGLRQEDAPAGVLLEEVRSLLLEAEDWAREEDVPDRTVDAIERSKAALAAGESQSARLLSAPSSENRGLSAPSTRRGLEDHAGDSPAPIISPARS